MKKLNLKLVGIDGNAFMLLRAFQKQAKKENWTPKEIKSVMDNAKSSDYSHLLSVLSDQCKNNGCDLSRTRKE